MRLMIAALAALWMITPASASPNTDDRYFDSRAPVAQQKIKVLHRSPRIKAYKRIVQAKYYFRHRRLLTNMATNMAIPIISSTPSTFQAISAIDVSPHIVSGPRPRAWCGWFLGKLLGLHDRSLWLARNWAHVGAAASKHVGAIVVWRHHVGKITAVRADGAIKVLSGNDGRAVRDRWRSARGVIAYRAL